VLPLGNHALGLAYLYGALAAAWLVLSWRDARAGLSFLAGPLLAPVGLIGLVPLAVQAARGPVRRAFQALAAVAVAAVAAGVRESDLPLGAAAPSPELAGLESPGEAARALLGSIPPSLGLVALVLAAAAAAIPYARGLWRIAGLGSLLLAGPLLLAPDAAALPLVATAWLACAALAWRHEH
jgi:hypothetical protein